MIAVLASMLTLASNSNRRHVSAQTEQTFAPLKRIYKAAAVMEVDEKVTRTPALQQYADVKVEIKSEYDDERHAYGIMPNWSVPSTNDELHQGSDFCLIKRAVVVLTRLPEYMIGSLRPPTPQQFYSEDGSPSSSDSDMQWEPEEDSSGSECSVSSNERETGKQMTAAPQPSSKPNNKNNGKESQAAPVIVSSAFGYSSNEITKLRPDLPEEEVNMDMAVLARRRCMRWQRGKIVDIVTREDGRLKYKVSFEEGGKSLVSGHHMAFDRTPKLEQLYVGARVVVQCPVNKYRFRPGVLAELPSRKNRLRFLVFLDNHSPVYVGLPLFHLVCKPLENVIDDIPDGAHKSFLAQYLKDWPYPHLTQYRTGQTLNVELDGAQQKCEVQLVDCSLMQILFQHNQQKEWVHRGSMRLEHMVRFLEMREVEKDSNDSD